MAAFSHLPTLRLVSPDRANPKRGTLASTLQGLRLARGMSRAQLAQLSDVAITSLIEFEEGDSEPRWSDFVGLAKALRVPLQAFAECRPAVARSLRRDNDRQGGPRRGARTGG